MNHILEKVESRYWKQNQKFGIKILKKSVEDAYNIDEGCEWFMDLINQKHNRDY